MRTVLIVGSGGREHALAWKVAFSPELQHLILAPGNDGMEAALKLYFPKLKITRWFGSLSREGFEELAQHARHEQVDLAIIGPDNPLAIGIADVLEEEGILTFGPLQAAAQLEASKGFAKEVMLAAGVPTADFQVFSNLRQAKQFVESSSWSGWVVKSDGLALGKGVRVCSSVSEAFDAIDELFPMHQKLVIEEKLQGEELSWMAFCDGESCALLDPACDYKRLLNRQQGPNTGGMGAFSPVPKYEGGRFRERIRKQVFEPIIKELRNRGIRYRGLLYAGLMVQKSFVPEQELPPFWVLEFNVRFGDPETQVLLPRIEGDLLPWLAATARGQLHLFPKDVPFSEDRSAVTVVASAAGYPTEPRRGDQVLGLGSLLNSNLAQSGPTDPVVFFAGMSVSEKTNGIWGSAKTAGGRVLSTIGLGENLQAASQKAYDRMSLIQFNGIYFRTDIAQELQ